MRISDQLCVLVFKNECDAESIKKFHELIINGADVTFKNPFEDNCTARELAASKNDLKWIRFLTKFCAENEKMSLNQMVERKIVEDKNVFGYKFATIHDSNLTRIDFANIKTATNSYHNHKVLVITKCAEFKDFVNLSHEAFHDNFVRFANPFVLILQVVTLEPNYENEIKCLAGKLTKAMILQVSSKGHNVLFFKEANGNFKKISMKHETPQTFELHANEREIFNFEFICNLKHCNPGKFGLFSFDFAKIEMNIEAEIEGQRLVDYAIKFSDLLSLRFLQLFNPNLNDFNSANKRILEVAAKHGTIDCLKILLNIPDDVTDDFETSIQPDTFKILRLRTQNDDNLLTIASKAGNFEIVKFLILCGLRVNSVSEHSVDKTISDMAWQNKKFDVVYGIIKADGPFPEDFDQNLVLNDANESEDLKKVLESLNDFHDHIKNNQIVEIEKFIQENSRVKCAYNLQNRSALTTALESKNFKVYAYLRSNGFSGGIDNDHEKVLQSLNGDESIKLRNCYKEFFKGSDFMHILNLLSRSRLGFNNKHEKFSTIRDWYQALDEISSVQPILKIVANATNLDIIFDFNHDSIHDVNPCEMDRSVKGITYINSGNIFIGAKKEKEARGVMAHEFMHYALNLVYNNQSKPFYENDKFKEEEFEAIVKKYDQEEMKSKTRIIRNAFKYSSMYLKVAELIVRPPHLMAYHIDEPVELEEHRKTFKDLFEFYEKILEDFKVEIPVMKAQSKIKFLNKILGVFTDCESSKFRCTASHISFNKILNETQNVLISSSVPDFVLTNLIKHLKQTESKKIESSHIFIRLDQLVDPKYFEMICEAFKSNKNPKLFVLDSSNSMENQENSVNEYLKLNSRTVLVSNEDFISRSQEFSNQISVNYQWADLEESSQKEVLSWSFEFQGQKMKIGEIFPCESKLFEKLPIEDIFNLYNLTLGPHFVSFQDDKGFYIERRFKRRSKEPSDDSMTADQVLQLLDHEKVVIIADDPGMGKTFTARHLAKQLMERNTKSWVVFIDLKQHVAAYVKDHDDHEIQQDFFTKKILKLGSLEEKLFDHFFEQENVIFIIDGFDEICPCYKTFVLKMIKSIQGQKNRLLITSRTHLSSCLDKIFEVQCLKLKPLTADDQVKLLKIFWSLNDPMNKLLTTEHLELLESLFARSKIIEEDEIFGNPLIIKIISELEDFSNFLTFKQHFFKRKIEIWNQKGPLAEEESLKLQSIATVEEIHCELALDQILGKSVADLFNTSRKSKKLTKEMILRIGILKFVEDGTLSFVTQTIARQLVSDFLSSTYSINNQQPDSTNELIKLLTFLEDKDNCTQTFLEEKLIIANSSLSFSTKLAALFKLFDQDTKLKFIKIIHTEQFITLRNFIKSNLASHSDEMLQFVLHKDENGDNFLHLWNSPRINNNKT